MQEMQETRVPSLGWNNPLEEEMATHSSIFAWKVPGTLVGYSPWGHKELVLEFYVLNFCASVWPSHCPLLPPNYRPLSPWWALHLQPCWLFGGFWKQDRFFPTPGSFFFFNVDCFNLLVLKMQSTNQCVNVQVSTQMFPPHRSFPCCCEHPSPSYLWWSVLCADLGRLYSPVI